MPKSKPPYPADFRARVVELARSGRTVRSIAREFNVTDTTIRSWVRQADLDTGRRTDGLTTEEKPGADAPPQIGRAAPRGARHPGKSRGLVRCGMPESQE